MNQARIIKLIEKKSFTEMKRNQKRMNIKWWNNKQKMKILHTMQARVLKKLKLQL